MMLVPSIFTGLASQEPVKVNAFPRLSTTIQNAVEEHETESRPPTGDSRAVRADQPFLLVQVNAPPLPSTAAQKEDE